MIMTRLDNNIRTREKSHSFYGSRKSRPRKLAILVGVVATLKYPLRRLDFTLETMKGENRVSELVVRKVICSVWFYIKMYLYKERFTMA